MTRSWSLPERLGLLSWCTNASGRFAGRIGRRGHTEGSRAPLELPPCPGALGQQDQEQEQPERLPGV